MSGSSDLAPEQTFESVTNEILHLLTQDMDFQVGLSIVRNVNLLPYLNPYLPPGFNPDSFYTDDSRITEHGRGLWVKHSPPRGGTRLIRLQIRHEKAIIDFFHKAEIFLEHKAAEAQAIANNTFVAAVAKLKEMANDDVKKLVSDPEILRKEEGSGRRDQVEQINNMILDLLSRNTPEISDRAREIVDSLSGHSESPIKRKRFEEPWLI